MAMVIENKALPPAELNGKQFVRWVFQRLEAGEGEEALRHLEARIALARPEDEAYRLNFAKCGARLSLALGQYQKAQDFVLSVANGAHNNFDNYLTILLHVAHDTGSHETFRSLAAQFLGSNSLTPGFRANILKLQLVDKILAGEETGLDSGSVYEALEGLQKLDDIRGLLHEAGQIWLRTHAEDQGVARIIAALEQETKGAGAESVPRKKNLLTAAGKNMLKMLPGSLQLARTQLASIAADEPDYAAAQHLLAALPVLEAQGLVPVDEHIRESLDYLAADAATVALTQKIVRLRDGTGERAVSEKALKELPFAPDLLESLMAGRHYKQAATMLKKLGKESPAVAMPCSILLNVLTIDPAMANNYPSRPKIEAAAELLSGFGYGAIAECIVAKWKKDSGGDLSEQIRQAIEEGEYERALHHYRSIPPGRCKGQDRLNMALLTLWSAPEKVSAEELLTLQSQGLALAHPTDVLTAAAGDAWSGAHGPDAQVLATTARAYAKAGQYSKTCNRALSALEQDPHIINKLKPVEERLEAAVKQDPALRPACAAYYAKVAENLPKKSRKTYYGKAQALLEAHLETEENDTKALTQLAEIGLATRDYTLAAASAARLLAADPENTFARFVRASRATYLGDFPSAIKDLQEILRGEFYRPAMDLFRELALHGVGAFSYSITLKDLQALASLDRSFKQQLAPYDIELPKKLQNPEELAKGARAAVEAELGNIVGRYTRSGFFERAVKQPIDKTAAIVTGLHR